MWCYLDHRRQHETMMAARIFPLSDSAIAVIESRYHCDPLTRPSDGREAHGMLRASHHCVDKREKVGATGVDKVTDMPLATSTAYISWCATTIGTCQPKKSTVAHELLNRRAHGYPEGLVYDCKTAWFTWRTAESLFRILRIHHRRLAAENPASSAYRPRSAHALDAVVFFIAHPFANASSHCDDYPIQYAR